MTALVEELELPLNVHRWRKLESSDPERYDLVRKAQSLQRNVVSKTESAVRKDLLIQEKVSESLQCDTVQLQFKVLLVLCAHSTGCVSGSILSRTNHVTATAGHMSLLT